MLASAASLPASLAMYFEIAPGVQPRVRVGVEAGRHLFDVGPGGLEPGHVRDDQLVGVALLHRQRAAGDHAFGRVLDGPLHGRPATAEAEGRDHQPGVAEDLLGLPEALALYPAD